MSGFYLFRSDLEISISSITNQFEKEGLMKPQFFQLGNYTLISFNKQWIQNLDNYALSPMGNMIFAYGTLTYRSQGFTESLNLILSDFEKERFDPTELYGTYCIIIFKNNNIILILDPAFTYHIFAVEDGSILSSSFLALVKTSGIKLNINRQAFLESALLGYVIGPETVFERFIQIDKIVAKKGHIGEITIIHNNPDYEELSYQAKNAQERLEFQIEQLKEYFKRWMPNIRQYGLALSLSGGLDSRLLLALCLTLEQNLTIYTHSTNIRGSSPYEDSVIAEQIGQTLGIKTIFYNTKEPQQMNSEELKSNLEQGFFFFGGRPYVGWLRSVRTPKALKYLVSNSRLSMNGLGGELYRNYNNMGPFGYNYIDWINYYILQPNVIKCFNDKIYLNEFTNTIYSRIIHYLDIPNRKKVDVKFDKRFYLEIFGPKFNGMLTSTENKYLFSFMPFNDFKNVKIGYNSISFQKWGSSFEAQMICKINKTLSDINTSYGYPPNSIPQLKYFLLYISPLPLKLLRHNLFFPFKQFTLTQMLSQKLDSLPDLIDILKSVESSINWDNLLRHGKSNIRYIDIPLSLAYAIKKFYD